jgi:hypothetical protein
MHPGIPVRLFFISLILNLACFSFAFCKGPDTTYIKDCRHFYNITLSFAKPHFSTTLSNSSDDITLKYRTLNPYRVGMAFDYRWFGLELTANLPNLKSQNIRKGETRSSSFRFTINSRKVAVLAFLQNYHGFYLNDNKIFYNPLSAANPLPRRRDMRCNMYLTQFQYFFNHKRYSNPAAAGQYERQLKSCGTPVLHAGFQGTKYLADSSFVPSAAASSFPNISPIRGLESVQVFLGAGYQYSFIFLKKFFINGSFIPALTWMNNVEVLTDQDNRSHQDYGIRYDARLMAGFNGERFYYGAWFTGIWSNQKLLGGNFVDYSFQSFRCFAGWRFRTRKSLGFLGL